MGLRYVSSWVLGMRRIKVLLLLVGVFWTASGCHCGPVYTPYANLIDDLSDRPMHLDSLYTPELDLSRIGHPDWCCWGLNRLLARCECEHCRCCR